MASAELTDGLLCAQQNHDHCNLCAYGTVQHHCQETVLVIAYHCHSRAVTGLDTIKLTIEHQKTQPTWHPTFQEIISASARRYYVRPVAALGATKAAAAAKSAKILVLCEKRPARQPLPTQALVHVQQRFDSSC
eukprot:SAG31_NODE_7498_length_1672_cov_8.695486_2_plen_134_part_00